MRWLAQIKNGDPSAESPAYRQHMEKGADLEEREQFVEAGQEYKLALTVQVKDSVAAARADFCEHMSQGLKLIAEGKKADAVNEFRSALRVVPNDPLAEKHLRKSMAK
jgi:Flp pilus assembly protein TadD